MLRSTYRGGGGGSLARGGGRRPSGSALASSSASASASSSLTGNASGPSPDDGPTVFPRPAYLDHSVLRDFLQTDAPPPSTSGSSSSTGASNTNTGVGQFNASISNGATPATGANRIDNPHTSHISQSHVVHALPARPNPYSYADPLSSAVPHHPWPRHIRRGRESTPATDSDDDSVISHAQNYGYASRGSTSAPMSTHSHGHGHGNIQGVASGSGSGPGSGSTGSSLRVMSSGNPVLRLPTRWSEHDRHHYLTVSSNGRDVSYHGMPILSFYTSLWDGLSWGGVSHLVGVGV
jgi:hypothetical protein